MSECQKIQGSWFLLSKDACEAVKSKIEASWVDLIVHTLRTVRYMGGFPNKPEMELPTNF